MRNWTIIISSLFFWKWLEIDFGKNSNQMKCSYLCKSIKGHGQSDLIPVDGRIPANQYVKFPIVYQGFIPCWVVSRISSINDYVRRRVGVAGPTNAELPVGVVLNLMTVAVYHPEAPDFSAKCYVWVSCWSKCIALFYSYMFMCFEVFRRRSNNSFTCLTWLYF